MIKVNLLDSVTDKTSVAAIETRVANPRTQGRLVLLVVVTLMALAIVFDWTSANSAHAEVTAELKRQQEQAARMEAIKREQAELEKKTQEIQTRIDAIKRLRASQQGPVAVLSAINERLPKITDFRLESIEQKGTELTLKGDSPNEAAVTQFGRSMEFSSGLFSNVSIETKRELMEKVNAGAAPPPGAAEDLNKPVVKPDTVTFTLKCKYTPPGSQAASPAGNAKPTGAAGAAAPASPQVAQNN
ncbi:MAG TPA: PilN domain-containing protein [Pyrinomonadaceae bacterium]|jgi:Tfp pilus assembly protein PilN|nr:PilN domain-containing protein [Pyrinomonadaceae bacterium]